MAFLYAMSDIHGELEVFEAALRQVDLRDTANKLLLLGDYIDYGAQSGQVLRSIHELQQSYGEEQVVVLKGNHEVMLLEWLETYSRPKARKSGEDDFFVWNDWLRTDKDTGCLSLQFQGNLMPSSGLRGIAQHSCTDLHADSTFIHTHKRNK